MVLTADVTLKTTNDWFDIVMDEDTGFGQQLGLLSSFESSKFEEPTFPEVPQAQAGQSEPSNMTRAERIVASISAEVGALPSQVSSSASSSKSMKRSPSSMPEPSVLTPTKSELSTEAGSPASASSEQLSSNPPLEAVPEGKTACEHFGYQSCLDMRPDLLHEVSGDPIYKLWVPRMRRVLEPLYQHRCGFQRRLLCGSLFSGLTPERKVTDLFDLPCSWCFSNDLKSSAVGFGLGNFHPANHHYIDASDFEKDFHNDGIMRGMCYHHGLYCSVEEFASKLDILFVTSCCQPYSKMNQKRRAGTKEHPTSNNVPIFIEVMARLQPRCLVFEQVTGFGERENRDDALSPLSKMIVELKSRLPQYHFQVFLIQGATYLTLERVRIYVVAAREDAGGRALLDTLKMVVQAQSCVCVCVCVCVRVCACECLCDRLRTNPKS